jgi:RNA polymerase sigma-70 factor, ECF subfamily
MTAITATLPAVYSMPAALRGPGELAASDSKSRALEQFLATVERRAFKVAQIALRHEDDALDAVQDAMLSLVTSYAERPSEEWKPLFYRILDNKVRDMQRRRTVRGRVMAWLPLGGQGTDGEDDEDWDPIAQAASADPAPPSSTRRSAHSSRRSPRCRRASSRRS